MATKLGVTVTDHRLLTVREAAERLALREGTIRLWLSRRRLPKVRLGRAVRIPADAVEEFVRSRTIAAQNGDR
jgi:excisionase family DNA binding protein